MKMRIQVIIEDESGRLSTAEIAALERRQPQDLIGISLDEAKAMTGGVQRALVESQAREAINRASKCPECQLQLRRNGSHRMSYRTPFGRLDLASPRFYRCRCQTKARQSFSPLVNWLGDHTSPELQYLEAQFAALLSYGVSARILCCVLPLQHATSITTWKRQVACVGARLDEEAHHRHSSQPALNEFGLPKRNPLRAVGIDGGYVKASDAPSRQEGWFEVMVGKSLPRAGNGQVFAFVHRLEPKPNERMERFLAEQGVFPAQPTTFLSDGGETVRQAQGEFREFGDDSRLVPCGHANDSADAIRQGFSGRSTDRGRLTASYRRASQRVKPSEGLPMARQSASSPAHARGLDLGYRNRVATRRSTSGQTRRIHELHRYQCGGDPELRRPSPARRADRDRLCRVCRQPGRQQATRQKATNAMDEGRRTSAAPGANPRAQSTTT
jgi:hypothetical protein